MTAVPGRRFAGRWRALSAGNRVPLKPRSRCTRMVRSRIADRERHVGRLVGRWERQRGDHGGGTASGGAMAMDLLDLAVGRDVELEHRRAAMQLGGGVAWIHALL